MMCRYRYADERTDRYTDILTYGHIDKVTQLDADPKYIYVYADKVHIHSVRA